MGELSCKSLSALLLLTLLAACQAAAPSTPLQPSQADTNLPSQPTQPPLLGPTQPSGIVVPTMPISEELSPTLSTTPTPQGISQEMDALIPPIPPAQLAATRQGQGVLLSWMGTGSDIDTHYGIYRRSPAILPGKRWAS